MTWTSPTGRRYDSPTPFDAPAEPFRELPDSALPPWWASDSSDSRSATARSAEAAVAVTATCA